MFGLACQSQHTLKYCTYKLEVTLYTVRSEILSPQCDRRTALDEFFWQILGDPELTKIAWLGSGCSPATEPTAEISYYYNITQVRVPRVSRYCNVAFVVSKDMLCYDRSARAAESRSARAGESSRLLAIISLTVHCQTRFKMLSTHMYFPYCMYGTGRSGSVWLILGIHTVKNG